MPNVMKMRQRDARDIACEVLDRCHDRKQTQSLFIYPDGSVRVLNSAGESARIAGRDDPCSFVGVYSDEAKQADIVGDILEMERAH